MRICIVGHFSDNIQEGVRNVTKEIASRLEKENYEVIKINVNSLSELLKIRKSQPDIIHFILSPTIEGLIVAKITSFFYSKPKIIISALHPSIPKRSLLHFFRPDLILTQSKESEVLFKSFGYNTEFLPNGVDLDIFRPYDAESKNKIRNEMNISPNDFIVLHLASMTKERNLSVLGKIQQKGNCQILIIGRDHEKCDKKIINELTQQGCRVVIKNFERMEDVYNAANCYIFPTIEKTGCIETPLSVLEAMACNLPIISTRFGALPKLFEEGDGFYFFDEEGQNHNYLNLIKDKKTLINTRKKVLSYSWPIIINKLCEFYESQLH